MRSDCVFFFFAGGGNQVVNCVVDAVDEETGKVTLNLAKSTESTAPVVTPASIVRARVLKVRPPFSLLLPSFTGVFMVSFCFVFCFVLFFAAQVQPVASETDGPAGVEVELTTAAGGRAWIPAQHLTDFPTLASFAVSRYRPGDVIDQVSPSLVTEFYWVSLGFTRFFFIGFSNPCHPVLPS